MKRYAVVAWDTYYPRGGLDNIRATFDTPEEVQAYLDGEGAALIEGYDSVEIHDLHREHGSTEIQTIK